MNNELIELIPSYVNGTIDDESRQRVELYVNNSQDGSQQLRLEKSLRLAARDQALPGFFPDRGLNHVLQKIQAEHSASRRQQRQENYFHKFSAWVASFMTPGYALASAVIACQFVLIGYLSQSASGNEDISTIRSFPVKNPANGVFIKLLFNADAKEADVRQVVRGVSGELVAGPSQIGEYYIFVAAQNVEAAKNILQNSNAVEIAELVDQLPLKQ